ncbi:MAG: 5-oxoprolinase subunit PxpA [Cyclobacteriaceae bacterium]
MIFLRHDVKNLLTPIKVRFSIILKFSLIQVVKIDLNSDLGEQSDSILDEQIMPYISSCNIACGGHAGDENSVRRTIDLAIKNKVAIGAHPGFPDRENFGRVIMEIDPDALRKSLKEQMLLAKKLTEEAGQKLHHVKPHGALYNLASVDSEISRLIISVLKEIDPELSLYGLCHSETEKEAKAAGVPFIGEAFADRKYELDKTLRNRKHDDAMIHEEAEVLNQVENLTFHKRAFNGDTELSIDARTICLHSDTKGAVHLAKAIHDHLKGKGATITAV